MLNHNWAAWKEDIPQGGPKAKALGYQSHSFFVCERRPKAEALGYLEANCTANLGRECNAD
jgi:hypothetical protein